MLNAVVRRSLALIACLAAAVWSAGCLDMERSLLVNKDLTGRAALKMAVDFDALVPLVIKMQHQAEGMTVVESTQKMEANKLVINLVIGVQDVTKVPLIAMPSIDQAPAGVDTSMKLFQDFEIKDEGSTILIASKAPAAAGGTPTAFQPPISASDLIGTLASATGMKPEDLTPLVNDMMKGMKVATRIESPLTVVDTNATTRDGASLMWRLSFEGGLDKLLAADPNSMLVSVRLKK